MRQFLNDNPEAFGHLEARAQAACIRFRDEELPPGSSPSRADIGFEVFPESGAARLLVEKRVRYLGPSEDVRAWLSAGMKEFASFEELKGWLQGPLAAAFQRSSQAGGESEEAPGNGQRGSEDLTDMPAVRKAIGEIHKPLYLDEDQLCERLKERVLGQDAALEAVAGVTVRHCARRRPQRPGVVFAIGPSGVGKTRTAEVLAQVLSDLDDEDTGYQFLRLDMTEYQEAHRVSQLIGAPQGYVGHGDGSQLTDALRANPRTIVLFDEIEKAHPAILRVLMNAMDAGRLSTATRSTAGREIDCRYAMFMFTSNLDAKEILGELETRKGFGKRDVEDEVCRRRLHAAGIAPEILQQGRATGCTAGPGDSISHRESTIAGGRFPLPHEEPWPTPTRL